MHEISVIYFDSLFSVIFFSLLWFSEPSLGKWDRNAVHGKWNSPGSIENHSEPFTSKTCSCSSKACLLCLKGAYLTMKGFGAHGIKSRGVRGQRATGRRYRPCFWKVISLGMLAFVQSICASVSQTQCKSWAGIDKHQISCITPYHTLPWQRFGLRENIPTHLRDVQVSDTVEMSSENPDAEIMKSKQFNLIAV